VTPDLERLEALARAATPGPWEVVGSSVTNWRDGSCDMEWLPNGSSDAYNANSEADAEYIAAASPDTVLAHIAEIRRLQRVSDLERAEHLRNCCAVLAEAIVKAREKLPSETEEFIALLEPFYDLHLLWSLQARKLEGK
jgi:hypothetical protein